MIPPLGGARRLGFQRLGEFALRHREEAPLTDPPSCGASFYGVPFVQPNMSANDPKRNRRRDGNDGADFLLKGLASLMAVPP